MNTKKIKDKAERKKLKREARGKRPPKPKRTEPRGSLLHGRHGLGVAGRPGAGPAIALSFLLVAIACALAGLCYAELASMIPIAGSAYTYAYATLGELVAWIIGWDLILEYAVSNMAVAVGFSAYLDSLLRGFGLRLPASVSNPVFDDSLRLTGSFFNLVGFLVVMMLTVILVRGIRESAGANNFVVAVKIIAILIFIVAEIGRASCRERV